MGELDRTGYGNEDLVDQCNQIIDSWDKQRDDSLDFPAHDDREDEERARYDALSAAETTEGE